MNAAISDEKQVDAFAIANLMAQAGLPDHFVAAAGRAALEYEGIYDLLCLWRDESEPQERDEIVADIQDMIDDIGQTEKQEAAYIRFNDLEQIAKDIRAFKDALRAEVDKRGGIGKLAVLTNIPQPSLSRFFSSTSMPRRNTLHKIARALNLDAVKIATEWSR